MKKIFLIIPVIILLIFSVLLFNTYNITSNTSELSKKFQLPVSFPIDYYTEEFWATDSFGEGRYQEIRPTKLDWLVILIIKKFDENDPNNVNKYSDTIIYLLDNRKGYIDKRSRMVMLIHLKENDKVFFSSLDTTYTDDIIGVDETTKWENVEIKRFDFCKKLFNRVVRTLEVEHDIISNTTA